MPRVIGTVKSIQGKAAVKTVDGQVQALKVGDLLHENEMVSAPQGDSKVTLSLEGGRELILNGNDQVLLDQSVFTALEEGESLDMKALQLALAEGLENLETAAGQEVLGESNAGAEFAERADGRGNVGSYLTGTESSPLGVTVDENGNFLPEEIAAAVVPNEGPGEGGNDDDDDDEEENDNNAPDAVDDSSTVPNVTYTIHMGGQDGDWNSEAVITSIGGGEIDINPGNGKLGVRGSDEQGQPLIENDGAAEAVKFEFKNLLSSVEVQLSSFNTANNQNDTSDVATWTVLFGSTVIASGEFEANPHTDLLVIDEDLTGGRLFDTLIIGTPIEGEHTNYFIDSLTGSGPMLDADLTVTENGVLSIAAIDLMANDSDMDGDALSIEDIDVTGTIGNVEMDADGNITYDPAGQFDYLDAGEVATDTFTYTLSDGDLTDTATVTVNIIGGSTSYDLSIDDLLSYDGGIGYDTVVISSSSENSNVIDFDQLSDKFDNIEHLDLKEGDEGKTLLNITPENVSSMTDTDNILKISGETDDALELDGFTLDTDASSVPEGYNAYTGTFGGEEVTLHIDEDITDINIIP